MANKNKFDILLEKMLKDKEQEMCDFLNRYLSDSERVRIGEDIVRIMPNKGDIAKIKLDILIDENENLGS